jgi:hypothetical protein
MRLRGDFLSFGFSTFRLIWGSNFANPIQFVFPGETKSGSLGLSIYIVLTRFEGFAG